jgi:hypothetical protein
MLLAGLRVVPCDSAEDILLRSPSGGLGADPGPCSSAHGSPATGSTPARPRGSADRFVVREGATACVEGPRYVGAEWPGGPGIHPGSEGDAK